MRLFVCGKCCNLYDKINSYGNRTNNNGSFPGLCYGNIFSQSVINLDRKKYKKMINSGREWDWMDKNKTNMRSINIIGSISTAMAIGFVVYVNWSTVSNSEKIKEDTSKPNSQIQVSDSISSIIDSMQHIKQSDIYMDSVDMDCNGY